jgi:CRISPR/Cas system CSM-associated protein Csm2 small subunit
MAYEAIDVDSEKGKTQFDNLVNFLEATLAYHKAHGGK